MKKNKNLLLTVLVVIAALGCIGFVLNKNKASNEEKTKIAAATNASVVVRTDTVKHRQLDMDFVANGNFAPLQDLTFSAEKAGRVVSVLVKEGSRVSIGQVLATIRVEQLSNDLENAKANYQNALQEKERFENAYKTGGVTQQQVAQQKLNLDNAAAKVRQASINIGDASIRSSINGIVNKKYIEPGSVLAPGASMFDIVNVSRLKLKVTVSEARVAGLKTGDPIQVTASVYPDQKYEGKVTFIAAKADNSLNFPVEIEIDNAKGNELKAGMYGTALFPTDHASELMVISRNAFVGSVSSNQVFVMDQQATARLRTVTSGRIVGDQVEILSGLKDGDIVIVSGQINLKDGAKVAAINN